MSEPSPHPPHGLLAGICRRLGDESEADPIGKSLFRVCVCVACVRACVRACVARFGGLVGIPPKRTAPLSLFPFNPGSCATFPFPFWPREFSLFPLPFPVCYLFCCLLSVCSCVFLLFCVCAFFNQVKSKWNQSEIKWNQNEIKVK